MRLDICLASDDNYAKYMGTTIASILDNAEDDEEIYFHLIDGGITEENKNKILSLKKIKNCEMTFYTPDIEKYEKWFEIGILGNKLSPATFYRLDIHKIIPNLDKILYLDCDIIVRDSLKQLFEKDITNYYALVVREKSHINNTELRKKLELTNDEFYFNAGMLMINTKLWRENKLEKKFQEYYYNNTDCYGDQDILNYCLKGKVYYLEYQWNFFPLKSVHDKLYDNVKIIHFITFKPWEYSGRIFLGVDEFWKYYQLTPWFFERPIDAIQTILAQKYSDYEDTKLKINNIKCFGIYHNRNTLQIVFFFIKITIEMNFKNVNKIAWWIPIKKYREAFKRAFDC